jgi:hypothetical protein
MSRPVGLFRICALAVMIGSLLLPATVRADFPILFPWSHSGAASPVVHATAPTYRTLGKVDSPSKHSQPQPIKLEPTVPQQIYAYGWFGSNPAPSWGRHFGTSKSYTQWTRR